MADISKIKLPGDNTEYTIKDSGAARSSHSHSNFVTIDTDQTINSTKTIGQDKDILLNLGSSNIDVDLQTVLTNLGWINDVQG